MKIVRHSTIWRPTLKYIMETPVCYGIFGFFVVILKVLLDNRWYFSLSVLGKGTTIQQQLWSGQFVISY